MPVSINNSAKVIIGNGANVVIANPISPIVQNGLVLNLNAETLLSYPGTGNIWYDLSGYGANGTLTNGVNYNISNGGYMFLDGTNDYIVGNPSSNSPLNVGSSGNVTIEMVFKIITVQPSYATLFSYGNTSNISPQSYSIRLDTSGNIDISAGLSSFGSTGFTAGIWYHLIVIFRASPNPVLLYRNGVSISNINVAAPAGKSVDVYYVGGNTVQFLNGNIGLVRVYNRELTIAEVTQNFNASRWRFGI